MFLGDVFRQMHFDQHDVEPITPGEYLDRHDSNQVATPCASSWGAKGYGDYWINESNAWTYRPLHTAGERMIELARRHPSADALTTRALNQAARELMLAQSSDWTFIMRTGTTVPYATKRINQHILQFNKLYDDLRAAKVNEPWLSDVESRNNIFPQIDYHIYAS
jgi:1,4-alpha-glucan branching enzyme